MTGEMILHSDLNCFYASVEMNENPRLRGKAVAVCGSTEDRHGIVLTASYPAKRMGVKTGAANWQARQCCPGLICVPPHYELYMKYSKLVRRIYARYTDDIEPFGMDENWLSIPYGRGDVEREGRLIAEEIRKSVREEIGLTVSIGVSFSKIFAKLGSDMKKPDAVTVISRANFQEKVWPLAVSELLYVGPATTRRLMSMNVMTIGDLAKADPELIRSRLGKNGIMLWRFANGADHSPVMPAEFVPPISLWATAQPACAIWKRNIRCGWCCTSWRRTWAIACGRMNWRREACRLRSRIMTWITGSIKRRCPFRVSRRWRLRRRALRFSDSTISGRSPCGR